MNKIVALFLLLLCTAGSMLAMDFQVLVTPEISGTAISSAISLLTGAVLVVRSRRK